MNDTPRRSRRTCEPPDADFVGVGRLASGGGPTAAALRRCSPTFSATDRIVAHCGGCSPPWSKTIWTARSRSSGEYLLVHGIGHILSRNAPSDQPGTVQCGGNWKRDYGGFYTGTQGDTPDTAKQLTCGSPRQFPTLPGSKRDSAFRESVDREGHLSRMSCKPIGRYRSPADLFEDDPGRILSRLGLVAVRRSATLRSTNADALVQRAHRFIVDYVR